MENNNYCKMDDEVIDLKELMLFILRKWRILIFAGVIGVALGCCAALVIPEKSIEDLDMSELHLEEIGQYARYWQLYVEQLRNEEASVYMNMDPQAVHTGSKIYYLKAHESDIARIGEMYNGVFRNESIYEELIDASGLNCSEMAMRELVSISFEKYKWDDNLLVFGEREYDVSITLNAVAPNAGACLGMLGLLDERVQAINNLVSSQYPNVTLELISDTRIVGYDPEVMEKRSDSAKLMATYVAELEKLEKKLSDDDMIYYTAVYPQAVEEEERGLGWLKWGIVIGVLFGGMMVALYGVQYLADGHVKTIDELRQFYGLHMIACLKGERKECGCMIDRLLMPKQQYSSDTYLRAVLKGAEAQSVHVCGDMKNAQVSAIMKRVSEENGVTISQRMATDENAQQMAKAADGVVLFVHLWNTKHAELARELEIAHHIRAKVLGVVVID